MVNNVECKKKNIIKKKKQSTLNLYGFRLNLSERVYLN